MVYFDLSGLLKTLLSPSFNSKVGSSMFAAEVYLNPSFDFDLSFDIKYKAPSMTTGIAI
jgi:hypothetical protein